jgi:hypothetical protein
MYFARLTTSQFVQIQITVEYFQRYVTIQILKARTLKGVWIDPTSRVRTATMFVFIITLD